jgi:hypothetical protein
VGTLFDSTESTIVISRAGSDHALIPRNAITRVEWSRGRHGNALKGLILGALAGATALTIVFHVQVGSEDDSPTRYYAQAALMGAVLGALPGAFVGSLISTERWAELPVANLRVAVVPAPRGVGVGLAWNW